MEKNSKINQIIIIVALALAGLYLGFIFNGSKDKKTPDIQANQEQSTVTQPTSEITLDNIKTAFNSAVIKFGDDSKKVIFLEISDPSCPFCHVAAGYNKELSAQMSQPPQRDFKYVEDGGTYLPPVPEMKKLVESGDASYALIYQNGHGNGEMAMLALYCAQDLNAFWKVKQLVMSNAGYDLINGSLKNDRSKAGDLANFLSSAVDKNAMKTCLESGKYEDKLAADQNLADSIGVSGTPGFFVNETKFSGAYSFKDMSSVVDTALGR